MDGTVLDTWFPASQLSNEVIESNTHRLGTVDLIPQLLRQMILDKDRRVEQVAVRTSIKGLSKPAVNPHSVYLHLHLLPHRSIKPYQLDTKGLYELLHVVAWTSKGPRLPDNFGQLRTHLRVRGLIYVYTINRMPRMVDYVLSAGIHIVEAERVRLGIYLAPGTSVLREGFVPLNSSTPEPCKIERRPSPGVIASAYTKVGLSTSVIATHDGCSQRKPLAIGECYHVNIAAGTIGVNLGDDCIIDRSILIAPDIPIGVPAKNRRIQAWGVPGRDNAHFYHHPDHSVVCVRHMERSGNDGGTTAFTQLADVPNELAG